MFSAFSMIPPKNLAKYTDFTSEEVMKTWQERKLKTWYEGLKDTAALLMNGGRV